MLAQPYITIQFKIEGKFGVLNLGDGLKENHQPINWETAIEAAEKAVKKWSPETREEGVNTMLALLAEPRAKYMMKYTHGDKSEEKVNKLAVSMVNLFRELQPAESEEVYWGTDTYVDTLDDVNAWQSGWVYLSKAEIKQLLRAIYMGDSVSEKNEIIRDHVANRLTNLQRNAVVTYYGSKITRREAARKLGVSEMSLKHSLSRGIASICRIGFREFDRVR